MSLARTFSAAILSAALFPLAASSWASAETISVYGTIAPIHISNVATGNASTGVGNSSYTTSSYWAVGVGGGVTITPIHLGPLSLGLDLRGSTAREKQGADTLLAGIKAGFKLPLIPLKPYVQASGGYVGTRATVTTGFPAGSTDSSGFYAYEILGGADLSILPHVDLRLIEIGAGQGRYRNGPNNNIPDINFITLNTGVVVHF